jgi:drug/metabolite transporter (DMT)-like permease
MLRAIQVRSLNVYLAIAANYIVAACLAGVYCASQAPPESWVGPAAIGAVTGCVYTTALIAIVRNMGQRGMALTLAISNLSMVLAVIVGYLFGERLNPWQSAGVVLAAVAVPLASLSTVGGQALRERPSALWAAALFFIQGGALSGNLVAARSLPEESLPAYLVCLFSAASVSAVVVWLVVRKPGRPSDAVRGGLFGALNVATTFIILFSLGHMAGAVFFPARSVLGLSLSVLISVFWWRERLHLWGWAGFALTIVATALLGMG